MSELEAEQVRTRVTLHTSGPSPHSGQSEVNSHPELSEIISKWSEITSKWDPPELSEFISEWSEFTSRWEVTPKTARSRLGGKRV